MCKQCGRSASVKIRRTKAFQAEECEGSSWAPGMFGSGRPSGRGLARGSQLSPTPPDGTRRATTYGGGRGNRCRSRTERTKNSTLQNERGREVPDSISHKVQQLQRSLQEADMAMSENEQMLENYRLANARKTMEVDELRDELHRSRDLLNNTSQCNTPRPHPDSTPLSPRLCSSCGDRYGEELDNVKLRTELEREKMARERAEFNSSKVMNLLDTSIRSHTPVQNRDEISDQIKELKQDLAESAKKLEENSEQYEQRLKEIDEKIRESSGSPNGKSEGAFEDLLQQVSQLKEELWQRDASEKRRQMLQQIRALETDLSSERQRHSTSVRQSRKLHSQVKQLGQELGLVKQEKEQALSCLEATSKHLGHSIDGREELMQKIEELQHALASSEKQRLVCVEKCGQLSQECFKQEVTQEALRDKIKEVETKMDSLKQDRKSMKAQQALLSQEVAEKKLSESKFRDQCGLLERQLSELVGVVERREVEFTELSKKLEASEKECTDGKVSSVQLKAELKYAEEQKHSLEEKVQSLELELEELQRESDSYQTELQVRLEEQQQWRTQMDNMVAELKKEGKKLEQCQQQRKNALANVSKLERQLEESKKKQATSYNNAVHAVKKLKHRCEEIEGESIRVKDERDTILIQHGELQKLLADCQTQLKNEQCRVSQVEKESSDMNMKLSVKEKECDSLMSKVEGLQNKLIELESLCSQGQNNNEKVKFELNQSQSDCESLKEELGLVKQTLEQCQNNEKRLTIELARTKDVWQKEVTQLQNDLETCRKERVKIVVKYKKLLATSQSIKSDLESSLVQRDHSDEERRSLEKKLDEVQITFSRKEQDLLKREQSYKLAQSQEMKNLTVKHSQIIESLQQTISTLELRLADEQSSLQDVRRQQLKVLDDQQKVYADDLSKSLEDTDRVRKKYLKAKKLYQEKAAALQTEITEFNGENESLRHKLAESQTSLMQQLEEYELLLREAAREVDTIVHQMGLRVDVPMFPTVVGDGTDVKKWMADMLAKLKWLQKEVTDLLTEESKLRTKVNAVDYKRIATVILRRR